MRFVAAGCLSFAVFAACPDRLASQAHPGSLGAHFDSLALAEDAKPHPDRARFERLAMIAVALAGGAEPGHVTMSIAGRPMSFQIVGLQGVRVHAVGWHDADADTMITVSAPVNDDRYGMSVALWLGPAADSGTADPPAFNFSVVSDTSCRNYYRLIHALVAEARRCDVGRATMSFMTLGTGGTLIASPEVTFGVVHIVSPPTP